MQIVCPACQAQYDVPDARLAPGKRVKCARCGGSWTPIDALPEPEAEPEPAFEDAPEPEPEPARAETVFSAVPLITPEARDATASDRLLLVGWIATAFVVVAVLIAAGTLRMQIEQAWPPSQRLYDLF